MLDDGPSFRPSLNMAKKDNWTREQHILAFNLYSQIPFGTIHMGNPKLQALAKLLGRSVGAVSYKLANFARLDPALHARNIKGAAHGAKGEEEVWAEFAKDPEALAFESQRLMAQYTGADLLAYAEVRLDDLPPVGKERDAIVKLRVNQNFFRRRVLSAYNNMCCITGLAVPQLLVASHIVPWSKDKENRLNVRNGLCLNALHDKAFDKGLLWITEKSTVQVAPRLVKGTLGKLADGQWLASFDGKPLILSKGFEPDAKLLAVHRADCERRS